MRQTNKIYLYAPNNKKFMLYYPQQVVKQLQTLKNYIKKRNPTTANS